MERIYSINVITADGYSFAVKGELSSEDDAIEAAVTTGLFDSPDDIPCAIAEDITNSQYDIDGLAGCTYNV